jgi:hypothetical protein
MLVLNRRNQLSAQAIGGPQREDLRGIVVSLRFQQRRKADILPVIADNGGPRRPTRIAAKAG